MSLFTVLHWQSPWTILINLEGKQKTARMMTSIKISTRWSKVVYKVRRKLWYEIKASVNISSIFDVNINRESKFSLIFPLKFGKVLNSTIIVLPKKRVSIIKKISFTFSSSSISDNFFSNIFFSRFSESEMEFLVDAWRNKGIIYILHWWDGALFSYLDSGLELVSRAVQVCSDGTHLCPQPRVLWLGFFPQLQENNLIGKVNKLDRSRCALTFL